MEAFRLRVEAYIYMARAEAELAEALQSAKFAWFSGTETARRQVRQVAASQPLIAGAIGVAAGALLAALLPPARMEDEAFGEMDADLRGKTLHETEKLRDGTKESARKIVSATADQATIETKKRSAPLQRTRNQ